jgi:hypothetical protein
MMGLFYERVCVPGHNWLGPEHNWLSLPLILISSRCVLVPWLKKPKLSFFLGGLVSNHGQLYLVYTTLVNQRSPSPNLTFLGWSMVATTRHHPTRTWKHPPMNHPLDELVLLHCGWTSTELIFGFTLVSNCVRGRSHM